MKKYLQTKISENETTNQKAAPDPIVVPTIIPKLVKDEKPSIPSIHPPLPLDPPPPDSPPKPRLTVKAKKDILQNPDEENQFNLEKLHRNTKTEKDADEPPKLNKPTVCRDFIRGACVRPTTCKFAHEYDLSQLRGVYTFCHNFQNSFCKHPNCKYVHATVFEEQTFYRTGVLPPHTIAHHLNQKSHPPSQPPMEMNMESQNGPPLHPSLDKPPVPCMPAGSGMPPPNTNMKQPFVENSAGKPNWTGHDNSFVGSPRAVEEKSNCDNCVLMENRLVHTTNKVESMKKSIDGFKDKLSLLDQKEKRLNAVLQLLMQPERQNN